MLLSIIPRQANDLMRPLSGNAGQRGYLRERQPTRTQVNYCHPLFSISLLFFHDLTISNASTRVKGYTHFVNNLLTNPKRLYWYLTTAAQSLYLEYIQEREHQEAQNEICNNRFTQG